ncbi:MAG: cytoplasmic protein [Latescibacteria bacterium DG_63]|nr:MAG: cytoplasmic protein [Latescibacteria bacterium DG_63]
MNRREFLRATGAGVAGAVLGALHLPFTHAAEKEELPSFVVAKGPSIVNNLDSAIEALGGISRFISKGDIVVVKPNIGWDRVPKQAATTNPELVHAIIRKCYEAGAKKVKVFDKTCNDPRRCYVKSGIADSARKAGAEVSFVDDRKFRRIKIGGEVLDKWPVYAEVLECDKIINVPIAKHHGIAKLTMALKNWMGVIGEPRNMLHQRIDLCLADLARFFKPSLTVLDATRILVANGPQGGNIKDVRRLDTLVAGTDQVAIDSYGTSFFGSKGTDLGYLVEAAKAGIGEVDLSNVRFSEIEVT